MSEFKTIFGVYGRYNHRISRFLPHTSAKRHRTAYGFDMEGRFKKEKVGLWRGFWLNRSKVFLRTLVCSECKGRFKAYLPRKTALKGYMCVRCSSK